MGIARAGGIASNGSGDIFIAFSKGNTDSRTSGGISDIKMLSNGRMSVLFSAVIQATEEAIIDALVAGETITGINGNTVYGIPHDRLRDILKKYNRLIK